MTPRGNVIKEVPVSLCFVLCAGSVVGGYSSELSQFTVQNQILYFNHRLLHHVPLSEPPPAFPVGSE